MNMPAVVVVEDNPHYIILLAAMENKTFNQELFTIVCFNTAVCWYLFGKFSKRYGILSR
jgi:hypothetical protein